MRAVHLSPRSSSMDQCPTFALKLLTTPQLLLLHPLQELPIPSSTLIPIFSLLLHLLLMDPLLLLLPHLPARLPLLIRPRDPSESSQPSRTMWKSQPLKERRKREAEEVSTGSSRRSRAPTLPRIPPLLLQLWPGLFQPTTPPLTPRSMKATKSLKSSSTNWPL